MASYSDGRWAAFQYKVSEMMQMPEFKYKPSATLMKYLQNTDFLIPASEKERVLGVKQSDQDTVELNFINKQTISTGSARAYNHTGSINDSTKATVSFTTYAADFTYSIKGADRTIWDLADQVATWWNRDSRRKYPPPPPRVEFTGRRSLVFRRWLTR